jgi:hypothetical protein
MDIDRVISSRAGGCSPALSGLVKRRRDSGQLDRVRASDITYLATAWIPAVVATVAL